MADEKPGLVGRARQLLNLGKDADAWEITIADLLAVSQAHWRLHATMVEIADYGYDYECFWAAQQARQALADASLT